MWTRFYDMCSGGDTKLAWRKVYIEASEEEARVIFENRLRRNPDQVTCCCCGPDYSVSEVEKPEKASPRDVLVIPASKFKPSDLI